MTEYDLPAIIAESVDSITAKLSEMPDGQLAELRKMESEAAKPRKTLLEAIDAVQLQRAAEKLEQVADVLDGRAAENDGDGASEGEGEGIATGGSQSLLDLKDAQITEQAAEIALLKERLAAMEKAAAEKPKAGRVRKHGVAMVETPDRAGLDRVVFATDEDIRIETLPTLAFHADGDLERDASGALTLLRSIAFPTHAPAATIRSAWLVGGDNRTGWPCRFHAPFEVGGGRAAELPDGHLRFDPPSA